MTRPGLVVDSHRRPLSWVIVAASLVAYLGLLVAVGMTGLLLDVPLPWWVAQTAPPLLYALLVLVVVRPRSATSLCGGALLLWAVHLLLGMLTEPMLALLDSPGASGMTWSFPPAPLPGAPLGAGAPRSPSRPAERWAGEPIGPSPACGRSPTGAGATDATVRGADAPARGPDPGRYGLWMPREQSASRSSKSRRWLRRGLLAPRRSCPWAPRWSLASWRPGDRWWRRRPLLRQAWRLRTATGAGPGARRPAPPCPPRRRPWRRSRRRPSDSPTR